MTKILQPVRGMNDILIDDIYIWNHVEQACKETFDQYGYQELRIPIVEKAELYERSIGESTDIIEKEMYVFQDRNGEDLALRPEATAGIVRAGLSNGLFHNKQQKLWCSGPMFRYEKPQKGRYRQFNQISVESIGFSDPEMDAELISMSYRIWKKLNIKSARLEINSLGTLEDRSNYRKDLISFLSSFKDIMDDETLARLSKNPLRILDSKNPEIIKILNNAPKLIDYLSEESKTDFSKLQNLLDQINIKYSINVKLVRGLDYYSKTVFEWKTDLLGSQDAICSGGRYDGLIEKLGGKNIPAVGWALGTERIVELIKEESVELIKDCPDIYIVMTSDAARSYGFNLAELLREKVPNSKIVLDHLSGSIKSQLKRADKSQARIALILGDNEIEQGIISVKMLRENVDQFDLSQNKLVAWLLVETSIANT
tara:strand:- start:5503 stop:6786 length:1284 start_codon:yes stop_codon:yes gene_type:complete